VELYNRDEGRICAKKGKGEGKMCKFIEKQLRKGYTRPLNVRNRLSTEPVILKVCNVKLSFDI